MTVDTSTEMAEPPPARVVVNSAWSLLGQAFAVSTSAAVGIYAVRSFSVVTWGHYATAFALVAVFMVISGAGLAPLSLRELTAAPGRRRETLGVALECVAWTSAAALVLLVIATAALGYSRSVVLAVAVFTPLLVTTPTFTIATSAFNAVSQLRLVAFVQIGQAAVFTSVGFGVLAAGSGILAYAAATTLAGAAAATIALALLARRLSLTPSRSRSRAPVWAFMRTAIPFGAIGVVGIVYDRVDTLMLSRLSSARDVAVYAVPYGFLQLFLMIPSVVGAAFFPLLARQLAGEHPEAKRSFFLVMRALLFVALPLSLFVALFGVDLLPFVFGHSYTGSGSVVRIMAWTLVASYPVYVFWYGIVAIKEEKRALGIAGAGLVVNVAVNAIAIPRWGPSGAAAALVASELAVVLGYAGVVHRQLFPLPLAALFIKPLAVGTVVIPLAVLLATRSAAAGACCGAAAYATGLFLTRYVTTEEWSPVVAVLRAALARLRGR